MDTEKLLDLIYEMFPNASCELNYENEFEFICAVLLSAQTTDKAVNKITPVLFSRYPDAVSMSNAKYDDVVEILTPLGLAKSKAKYLINLSDTLVKKYNGSLPTTREELESLPGVGRKTCSVYLAQIHNIPQIAVDTHVHRVSKRIGLTGMNSDVLQTEKDLKMSFPKNNWIKVHHGLLFLGRYLCKSKKPECTNCKIFNFCMRRGVKND